MDIYSKPPKDLREFVKRFNEVCECGFIKTHRSGDTGVGKTLEDILGIPENNDQLPDFSNYELKSRRNNKANSLTTLITKSPEVAGANAKLRDAFGVEEANGFKKLHATLKYGNILYPNNGRYGIGLLIKDDKVYITSDGKILDYAYWNKSTLCDIVKNKYSSNKVIYVEAESKGTGENEEFKYMKATLAVGINGDKIFDLIEEGKVVVDLRIGSYKTGDKKGKVHDHGTGFRISEGNKQYLYENVITLVDKYKNFVIDEVDIDE